MDVLTKELHNFLLILHEKPDCVSHKLAHYLEHIFHLLNVNEEEAVLHYYGILGHEQLSLQQIATENQLTDADMLSQINNNLHRLAVTPEWQMIKQLIK